MIRRRAIPGPSGQLAAQHVHAVQFYGDDQELSTCAGRYLGEGLMAGEAAVVVATPAHRLAFEAELARLGVDCGAARSAGMLLVADAGQTLDGFLAGDRLDRSRFRAAAGDLAGRAAEAGRPVRIYAEMVALLWEAGQVTLALELEALWDDLASRLPFALLCAYPARLLTGEYGRTAVQEVCTLHTAVIGPHPAMSREAGLPGHPAEAVRSFPPDREATRAARQFVFSHVATQIDPALAIDAELITAELTANAVVHARSAFTVTVSQSAAGVRISVRDTGPWPPGPGHALAVIPGHGLDVVAKIATRWVVEPLPDGKVVWAELPILCGPGQTGFGVQPEYDVPPAQFGVQDPGADGRISGQQLARFGLAGDLEDGHLGLAVWGM